MQCNNKKQKLRSPHLNTSPVSGSSNAISIANADTVRHTRELRLHKQKTDGDSSSVNEPEVREVGDESANEMPNTSASRGSKNIGVLESSTTRGNLSPLTSVSVLTESSIALPSTGESTVKEFSPAASLRNLSDAAIVARQIVNDLPAQALYVHYGSLLRPIFEKFALRRVQGVQVMNENGWLRFCKSMGLMPSLVSAKSLRHFAISATTGTSNDRNSTDAALTTGTFFNALGLCAIYIHREKRDAWSLREKVLVLLNMMSNVEPSLGNVRIPTNMIGPRIESFLYSLFEHFASSSTRKGGGNRANKTLTNWGWAKLLRGLQVSESAMTSKVHPDIIYTKYATKGKLSFESFIQAMTEFDRLYAERSKGDQRSAHQSPQSRQHNSRDQENSPPLAAPLANLTALRN